MFLRQATVRTETRPTTDLDRPDQREFDTVISQPTTAASPRAPATAVPPVPFTKATGCRWIFDRAAPDALTCNATRVLGTSWCPHHLRRVYLPARRR
jgi:hypothetical protein